MPYTRKLSNLLIINEMMHDTLLTKAAKFTGTAIILHRNLKTLECFPSQETLSMILTMDEKTIRKGIKQLQEKIYLVVVKERPENAKWDQSYYYFLRDWAAQKALVNSDGFKGDLMRFRLAWSHVNTIRRENTPTNRYCVG